MAYGEHPSTWYGPNGGPPQTDSGASDRPSRDRAAIDDLRAEVARLRDMCRVVVVALLLAWGTLAWLVNR